MRKSYLNTENLAYLTVFLLPTYLIRIRIFGLPTNILEILIGFVFVIWLAERGPNVKWKNFYQRYKKHIFAGGLVLLGLFVSTFLASKNYLTGLGIIKSWFVIPIIFMAVTAETVKKENLKNVFFALYFSTLATALVSLAYLFSGNTTYDGRLEAFFNSPNYLAMYLAPGIIIGASFAIYSAKEFSSKPKSILFGISLIILLLAFYKTYSYAAWASLIASISTILIIKNRLFRKSAIAIGIIVALMLVSQINSKKFNDLSNLDSRSSLASREMIWTASKEILKNHWVIGIGPGNFQKTYLEYQKYFPPYLEWAVPHPHNIFLAFWLSGGILALSGFLLLMYFWVKEIVFLKNKDAAQMAAIGIMIYALLHGLVDTTYFKNDLAIIFWLAFLALKRDAVKPSVNSVHEKQ